MIDKTQAITLYDRQHFLFVLLRGTVSMSITAELSHKSLEVLSYFSFKAFASLWNASSILMLPFADVSRYPMMFGFDSTNLSADSSSTSRI